MTTKTYSSRFYVSEETTPKAEVHNLCAAVLELTTTAGDELKWNLLQPYCPTIKYSRGWLIGRRFQLEQFAPDLISDLTMAPKADGETRFKHGKVFHAERMQQLLSWGEIMVRHNVTEGYVRACFELAGVEKSVGTRTGKGGRFLYGDPQLYLENRKAEGAQIPVTFRGRPMAEQLLNFKAKDGESNAATRGRAMSTIVKLRAKANDKAATGPEAEAFHAKADELMSKYRITVQDVNAWKAARASKGKRVA